jgi:hypothetical protein
MLLNEQCLLIDLSDVNLLLTEEEMEVIWFLIGQKNINLKQ